MRIYISVVFIIALAVAITSVGCTTQPEPFKYEPDNELKKGPGLFSGEKGAFTIYREPMESEESNSAASEKNQRKEKADPSTLQ